MIKIRAVTDQHSPAIDQATLARFLTEGYFLSHIKRMRKLYSDRRDFFIDQFNKSLNDYFILEVRKLGYISSPGCGGKQIYHSSRGFAQKLVSGRRRYPHAS